MGSKPREGTMIVVLIAVLNQARELVTKVSVLGEQNKSNRREGSINPNRSPGTFSVSSLSPYRRNRIQVSPSSRPGSKTKKPEKNCIQRKKSNRRRRDPQEGENRS